MGEGPLSEIERERLRRAVAKLVALARLLTNHSGMDAIVALLLAIDSLYDQAPAEHRSHIRTMIRDLFEAMEEEANPPS